MQELGRCVGLLGLVLIALVLSACDRSPDGKAWSSTVKAGTVSSYEAYEDAFPNGKHMSEAQEKLRSLGIKEIEGTVKISMEYGGFGSGGVNLTPSIEIETANGIYALEADEATSYKNMEKSYAGVMWTMGDAVRYRVRGQAISQKGTRVMHADLIEKIESKPAPQSDKKG